LAVRLYPVLGFACLAEWRQFTCSGLLGLCWTGLLMRVSWWPYLLSWMTPHSLERDRIKKLLSLRLFGSDSGPDRSDPVPDVVEEKAPSTQRWTSSVVDIQGEILLGTYKAGPCCCRLLFWLFSRRAAAISAASFLEWSHHRDSLEVSLVLAAWGSSWTRLVLVSDRVVLLLLSCIDAVARCVGGPRVVSQFTLHAVYKGSKASFHRAMPGAESEAMFYGMSERLRQQYNVEAVKGMDATDVPAFSLVWTLRASGFSLSSDPCVLVRAEGAASDPFPFLMSDLLRAFWHASGDCDCRAGLP